jgi:hypothetical protein
VVVDRPNIDVIKLPHHFLRQPDIFLRVDRLDTVLATRCDKGQVFRCGRPHSRSGGFDLLQFFVLIFHSDATWELCFLCCVLD